MAQSVLYKNSKKETAFPMYYLCNIVVVQKQKNIQPY